MVFNHTSDTFNPLWQQVLTSPDDSSGGLYFSGSTPWGNRIASERPDVQAMLIDACRLFLTEYHVDGFRFDATYHDFMSHQFLLRLATELHDAKPGVLLVAENLPNEPDLNRSGYDGYAQWCNQFHDKVKALLREGQFEGEQPTPDHLADAMYFSHASFASHTSNVVNYCQSHDENSVAHEVRTMPNLDNAFAADRKGRLGVLTTLVALGQPMLFMGQEFNLDQPRNVVTVDWPADLDQHEFFRWTCGMVHLRRRYPGLRLSGYDPAGTGQFTWILGPWMDDQHGAGRPVVGWRAQPSESADQTLVVLLNFSPQDMTAELELGLPGRWVKLADIGTVEDVPPAGTNSAGASTALVSADGRYSPFVLPASSGFIYKWEAPL
jgi:pullulanase/glycogen debranching enzyme